LNDIGEVFKLVAEAKDSLKVIIKPHSHPLSQNEV
jgi:hypothetical protein